MLTEKKKKVIILISMMITVILAVLPWATFLFSVIFHSDVVWYILEGVYFCGLWWWIITLCIAVYTLVQTIVWKRTGSMVVTILLLFLIPIAGISWLALLTLLKHPPA